MTYTLADRTTLYNFFTNFFRNSGQDFPFKDIQNYSSLMFISELQQDPANALVNANLLIDTLNKGRSNLYPHYTSQDLDTMSNKIVDSGESTLSTRDRLFLRILVIYSMSQITDIPFVVTYNSDGVPDYYDTVIKESGKTTREVLMYAFKLSNMIATAPAGNPFNAIDYTYLNSYIPAKLSPNFTATSLQAALSTENMITPDSSPLAARLMQTYTLGPAYIAGTAEKVWKLDLTWPVPT